MIQTFGRYLTRRPISRLLKVNDLPEPVVPQISEWAVLTLLPHRSRNIGWPDRLFIRIAGSPTP
ncbi:hypothetical protein D3C81_2217890 [compost metagenome]